jgi:hypothetical protein
MTTSRSDIGQAPAIVERRCRAERYHPKRAPPLRDIVRANAHA